MKWQRIEDILDSAQNRNNKLRNICKFLRLYKPYYDWVGFYIADNSQKSLQIGPFEGEPTEHKIITYGKGICGQVAENKTPAVIQDISQEYNYLSCSLDVKSEMVIPIFKDRQLVAELDIDSHSRAPFTEEDKEYLSEICDMISILF
jgi:GAF domain-containing protein